MNNHPKISVIIPVFNKDLYLRECLDSLLNQTLRDIEIICINDGSTDNSLSILSEYSEKDDRIKIINQKNTGAGASRNIGLKIAQGEYLSFLDGDDFFEVDMLQKSYSCSLECDADITVFKTKTYNNVTGAIESANWALREEQVPNHPFTYIDIPNHIFGFSHTCAWNKLFKAAFIRSNNIYFQNLPNTNDLFFVCLALVKANKIAFLSEELLYYRTNNNSSLSAKESRQKDPDVAYFAFKALKHELINMGVFNIVKKSYVDRFFNVFFYNLQQTSGKSYSRLYNKLRKNWIPELSIHAVDRSYFQVRTYYDIYIQLVKTPLWKLKFANRLRGNKVICSIAKYLSSCKITSPLVSFAHIFLEDGFYHALRVVKRKIIKQKQNIDNITDKSNNNTIDLYSFDIFDTLITRQTATPLGIFAVMQHELRTNNKYKSVSPYIKNNFFTIRVETEKYIRRSHNLKAIKEVTFDEIYDLIGFNNNLSYIELNYLKELEIQTEINNIIAIPENIQKLKTLKSQGKKVVLVSDMYHSLETIKKILDSIDLVFKDIRIYLSCECYQTKHSGELFKKIKEKEHIDYPKWKHIGDNYQSDIVKAKSLGIITEYYRNMPLEPYENYVLKDHQDNCYLQLAIGASRNARRLNSRNKEIFWGCSLGGILLFPYVDWIIKQSLKRGISRLYFIARDGFVLKTIADLIIEYYNYPLKTHYIYGSREAWRIASISHSHCDFSYIFDESWSIRDINSLAMRFQIKLDDLYRFIPRTYRNKSRILTDNEIKDLRIILANDINFKQYLINLSQGKRETVIKYLQQEIDFRDDNFAFVDLYGTGTTQDCLASIISSIYNNKIKTFYFHLSKTNQNKSIKYNYFPTTLPYLYLIEIFCRAPHGQTLGYKYSLSKYVPILDELEGKAVFHNNYKNYISGVESYTSIYLNSIKNNPNIVSDFIILSNYIKYIMSYPDDATLAFIAKTPFVNAGISSNVQEYAPTLTFREIIKIYLLGKKKSYGGVILELSEKRCSKYDILLIRVCKKLSKCRILI